MEWWYTLEELEAWKSFLNKEVRIIINDPPSPYPKSKDGIFLDITPTHIILKQPTGNVALLLTDIRRIQLKEKGEEV